MKARAIPHSRRPRARRGESEREDQFLTNREESEDHENHQHPKKDLYAQVTDSIIAMMESGKTSHLTWARSGDGLPRNHKTGTAYQGVNVLLLWAAAMTRGYTSDRWLTYKQAAEMGGQVRKGEKSVTCVFFKTLERESENEGDEHRKSRFHPRD